MVRSSVCVLTMILWLSGCASPVPLAVTCPPPPPVPQILTEPASTEPSLTQQLADLMQAFRESLVRAMRTE